MDAHQRFQEWLAAGAEGEPPRDLAIHASVCAACQESMAAFDRLAMVDSGRARMPGGLAAPIPARPAQVPPPIAPPAPPVRAPIAPAPVAPVLAAAPAVPAAAPAKRDPILFKRVPPKVTALGAASISYPPGSPPPPPGTANGDQGEPRRIGRIVALVLAAVLGALVLGFGVTQALNLITGAASGPTPTPGQSELQTTQPSASILPPSATPTGTPVPTEVPTPTPTPIPTPKPTPPPPPGAPSSPRNLTAVVSIGHIALSWSAPTSSGGSNIFRYDLYRDGSGTPFWTGNAFSHTDSNAGNGQTHVYRVTAVNAVGSSAYSSPASGTTPNVPGAPGNPQAAAVGVGPNSFNATATTWTSPGAPTGVTASAGNGQILVSWTAPAFDGNTAITGYSVYDDSLTLACTTTGAVSCADTGLGQNVSHTYTVKATNAFGQGAASSPASNSATTWSLPGAPTGLTASDAVSGEVDVSWTAPAFDGNTAIIRYDIYRNGAFLGSSASTSYIDSTAVPLTTYSYTVTAHNAVGDSAPSNADDGTAL